MMERARNCGNERKSVTWREFFFFFLMVERSLETDGNYIIGSERAAGPIVKSKIHASQTCDSPFPRLHLFINIHERRNYYNSPGYITIRFGNKRKKYGSNFSKRNEKNKNLFNFEFFERREMEFIYIYKLLFKFFKTI